MPRKKQSTGHPLSRPNCSMYLGSSRDSSDTKKCDTAVCKSRPPKLNMLFALANLILADRPCLAVWWGYAHSQKSRVSHAACQIWPMACFFMPLCGVALIFFIGWNRDRNDSCITSWRFTINRTCCNRVDTNFKLVFTFTLYKQFFYFSLSGVPMLGYLHAYLLI
jgi:hypothetical protein